LKAKALILAALLSTLLASGCSSWHFPGVHRITIQQGNVITQQMVDKLRPGMTRSQVKYVLGNPLISDPLNINKWNYYYSNKTAHDEQVNRLLYIYFVDNRLSYFSGHYLPQANVDQPSPTT
jgi:outer membrane protein assembly factor BamE